MKDKKMIALVIAVGVFFLFSRSKRQRYIPPPPPPAQPNYYELFKNWALAILNIFGDVKELWEPGGPFYNKSKAEQEAIRKAQEEWTRKKINDIISNS